jgi:hypothetical protein
MAETSKRSSDVDAIEPIEKREPGVAGEDPGVAEGLGPLMLPLAPVPALPALPPLEPPDWARARPQFLQ